MKDLLSRITSNPAICNGKPIIRGRRITASTVLNYLASGDSMDNILEAYPVLEREDILACLEFAKKIADKSILTYDLKAS